MVEHSVKRAITVIISSFKDEFKIKISLYVWLKWRFNAKSAILMFDSHTPPKFQNTDLQPFTTVILDVFIVL